MCLYQPLHLHLRSGEWLFCGAPPSKAPQNPQVTTRTTSSHGGEAVILHHSRLLWDAKWPQSYCIFSLNISHSLYKGLHTWLLWLSQGRKGLEVKATTCEGEQRGAVPPRCGICPLQSQSRLCPSISCPILLQLVMGALGPHPSLCTQTWLSPVRSMLFVWLCLQPTDSPSQPLPA